jgi:hypothetical protein
MSEQTWAEGNTNQAYRNLADNLDGVKLGHIKAVCEIYLNNIDGETVDSMDNNFVGFFAGIRNSYENVGDTDGVIRWDAMSNEISEKCAYIRRTGSFESIVLYLLKRDPSTLKKLLVAQKRCYAKKDSNCDISIAPTPKKQSGGSSTIDVVKEFVKIREANASIVVKILESYDNLENDPFDTQQVYYAIENTETFWMLHPNAFKYSDRHEIQDVWKFVVFLLQRPASELRAFSNKHKKLNAQKRLKTVNYDLVAKLNRINYKSNV